MEQSKVMEFVEENKDYLFPNNAYTTMELEDALIAVPEEWEMLVRSIPFRKPTTVQLISVIVGSLGVDRFYLGDIKCGILKYFSFGGLGIWWIADIFSAKDRCRAYNCKKLMEAVNDPSVVGKMQNTDAKIGQAVNTAKAFAPAVKELAKGIKNISDTNHPW